jgi:hypothetical protein
MIYGRDKSASILELARRAQIEANVASGEAREHQHLEFKRDNYDPSDGARRSSQRRSRLWRLTAASWSLEFRRTARQGGRSSSSRCHWPARWSAHIRSAKAGVDPVPADNLIRTGQAACSYSWRMPPSRSRRRMSRRLILPGSAIGVGSERSGRAFAMPW